MRLGTVQQNSDDMMERERHGLTKSVVKAIRTLLDQGRTQQDIADLYGVKRETVSAIATARVYKKVEWCIHAARNNWSVTGSYLQ
jgi:transcriptional regulator